MKTSWAYSWILVLLFACDSTVETKNGENTASSIPQQRRTASGDTLHPILIARGHEPGWFAQFYEHRLRLLYNYGEDSLHVRNDFSALRGGNAFQLIKPANCEALTVDVRTESCTEAGSGEQRERTVIVTLGDLRLRGCGTEKPE